MSSSVNILCPRSGLRGIILLVLLPPPLHSLSLGSLSRILITIILFHVKSEDTSSCLELPLCVLTWCVHLVLLLMLMLMLMLMILVPGLSRVLDSYGLFSSPHFLLFFDDLDLVSVSGGADVQGHIDLCAHIVGFLVTLVKVRVVAALLLRLCHVPHPLTLGVSGLDLLHPGLGPGLSSGPLDACLCNQEACCQ